MIIDIAIGVMLGLLFFIAALIVLAGLTAGIVKIKDAADEGEDDYPEERPVRRRIRPEQSRYEELQRLKRSAQERRPDHWRRK